MRVLVAMDEFNGIVSSYEANRYVEEAVASQIEEADIVQVPLFNGRHELMDSVFLWQSGTKYRVNVHDADMKQVEGVYGKTESGMTIIEADLFLQGNRPLTERTSYGLGELIAAALDNDAKHLVISLGNIASFDGGAGMLQALGAKYYNDEGEPVDAKEGVGVLKYIRRVDFSGLDQRLKETRIQLVSDFASKMYGKESEIMQVYKLLEISREEAATIDNLVWYFSEILKNETRTVTSTVERGGAGGGIAAVLAALYNAEVLTSHSLVDQITHLENLIEQADLIMFGEGINEQDHLLETTSLRIAELATKYHKPCIAINATADKFDRYEALGVTGMFNLFMTMPKRYTSFEAGLQIRFYAVQALKLLTTTFNTQNSQTKA
ncbi:glycerate kinase [Staphylococcus sp. HMSC061G12]|uniref:glycerate kinase n=1 Tax=Staphylococcus sp. HMSC061G12 TaxID=1739441 RepID=UPI0008A92005|nr:glycerate kinase [Staphylococcus sp. HMSC061G12]OHR61649.1 glycerate kinase [Staphylococcus sp. HMSC061G12]